MSVVSMPKRSTSSRKVRAKPETMQEELNKRYSPITNSKHEIKTTYIPIGMDGKAVRVRTIKSLGKLNSPSQPKMSKYVLNNLIKIKDKDFFPEKATAAGRKTHHKRKATSPRKVAEGHFTRLKEVLKEGDEVLELSGTTSPVFIGAIAAGEGSCTSP